MVGAHVPREAEVEVPGQEQVDPGGLRRLQGVEAAADHGRIGVAGRGHERMVGDEDLEHALGQGREVQADGLDLGPGDAPVLERPGARGVDPHGGEVLLVEEGGEVRGQEAAVVVERAREAREHVPQGHVVVARHDQHRARQAVQEGAGGAELARPRPLREVAADGHEHRRAQGELLEQRRRHRRILASKVQVRDVGDGSQGTMTRSARGRMR